MRRCMRYWTPPTGGRLPGGKAVGWQGGDLTDGVGWDGLPGWGVAIVTKGERGGISGSGCRAEPSGPKERSVR